MGVKIRGDVDPFDVTPPMVRRIREFLDKRKDEVYSTEELAKLIGSTVGSIKQATSNHLSGYRYVTRRRQTFYGNPDSIRQLKAELNKHGLE